jgi:hypothetical protein
MGGDSRASTGKALAASIMVSTVREPPAPATTSVAVADKIKYACDQLGMFGVYKTQSIYQPFAYPYNIQIKNACGHEHGRRITTSSETRCMGCSRSTRHEPGETDTGKRRDHVFYVRYAIPTNNNDCRSHIRFPLLILVFCGDQPLIIGCMVT